MPEKYKKFNAADYIKTDEDVQDLLEAAKDEDTGDGAVIRAVSKFVASSRSAERRPCRIASEPPASRYMTLPPAPPDRTSRVQGSCPVSTARSSPTSKGVRG